MVAQATGEMRFAGNLDARGYQGPVDEQQLINLDNPLGGTYTLSFRGDETGPLNFDAGADVVQAALEGLDSIGAGNVAVSPAAGGFQVDFIGDLAESDLTALRLDSSNLVYGIPAIQVDQAGTPPENALYSIDFAGVTDGQFNLRFNPEPGNPTTWQETGMIEYVADLDNLREAISTGLAAIDGYGEADFDVTTNGAGQIEIEFTGNLADQPIALELVSELDVDPDVEEDNPGSFLDPRIKTIDLQGAEGGSFRLAIEHDGGMSTTSPISYDANAEELRQSLAAASNAFSEDDFAVVENAEGNWEVSFLGSHDVDPILDLSVIDPENLDYGNDPEVTSERSGREERIVPHQYEYYVFDSLGRRNNIDFTFTPVDYNVWEYNLTVTDEGGNIIEVDGGGNGMLVFDQNGGLIPGDSNIPDIEFNPPGEAAPMAVTPDFGAATQLAGLNSLLARAQDGFAAGTLAGFNIERTGLVVGTYTNGLTEEFGQIETATFPNPEGLAKQGGNLYRETVNSGEAAAGVPGGAGRGLIQSSALELSNTDLAYEFTELITTSRAFQANTRVITTSDEILTEVVNMKR